MMTPRADSFLRVVGGLKYMEPYIYTQD